MVDFSTTVWLCQTLQNVAEKCQRGKVILHHDIAKAQTADRTTEYLNAQNIKAMNDSPYCPDAAFSDVVLFPQLTAK